jgi:diguanylate cyclase (GGDEF)-like protein
MGAGLLLFVPMAIRRDSFTIMRDTLRWRVAVVLAWLVSALMVVLGSINVSLGLPDTALLAWIVLAGSLASLVGLFVLPRDVGGSTYFGAIVLLLVGTMFFGWYVGKPMQHWAYILPPVMVFLLRSGPALVGMLLFGTYAAAMVYPLIPGIDVVRFASGYGLLVCFMYTYALLQERAGDLLRYHSDHDALSNCLNRRTFNETLEQLPSRRRDCSFLLVDIDHFKTINDQHGHLVGDRIITQVAAALGRELDAGTALFRYGGEEFAVLLPDAEPGHAALLGERLRGAIESTDFQGVKVTVSIGVAHWRAGRGPLGSALDRADRALYAAKRAGRNRVVADPPEALAA